MWDLITLTQKHLYLTKKQLSYTMTDTQLFVPIITTLVCKMS